MKTNLTEAQKGYLAGIIDGEGCFYTIRGLKTFPTTVGLVIVNTDKTIIDWLLNYIGGKVVTSKGKHFTKKKSKMKRAYRWNIFGLELKDLLQQVQPHLVAKQKQGNLILDFIKTMKYQKEPRRFLTLDIMNKRKEIERRLHILNKKGRDQQIDLIFDLTKNNQLTFKEIKEVKSNV